MARNESDREDLMREAVSLVRRLECKPTTGAESLTIGFNALGWLFVYFGQDLMYRFDELGRLRRALVDGLLFRTAGQTLTRMRRQRSLASESATNQTVSELLTMNLSFAELAAFQTRMRSELKRCLVDLREGAITRRSPEDDELIATDIEHAIQVVLESSEFLAPAIVRR